MTDPADYPEEYTNYCAEMCGLKDSLRAACDLLSLQGPTFAWKAKGFLEAAGVPLTLTVREECGMPREGGDEP